MGPGATERQFVGLSPWLPWPLSGWRWWTAPVRAERLAVLRIGLAFILLLDLLITYLPILHDYWGKDSLGDGRIFSYRFDAPRWNLSPLRGVDHPLNLLCALGIAAITTFWVLAGLVSRLSHRPDAWPGRRLRWPLVIWLMASTWALIGLWANRVSPPRTDRPSEINLEGFLSLAPAFALWSVATAFLCLAAWERLRERPRQDDRLLAPLVLVVWVFATILLVLGLMRYLSEPDDAGTILNFRWARGYWDDHEWMLTAVFVLWVACTVLLLIGLWTRPSTVVVWILSTSFANMNPYADNAGDQMRTIILFYLMLCPCGTAWSVDRRLARRRGAPTGPVYVSPWVLRLLFVQMTFTYFANGVFKVFGNDWRKGYSLYYVLNDFTLTRWSYAQFPMPVLITQILSITILMWELFFPVFVMLPWWVAGLIRALGILRSRTSLTVIRFLRRSRVIILLFGVAFHLGIFISMELGGFGLYMICLYLPLVPWERWFRRKRAVVQLNKAEDGFSTRAYSA
jgi:hypothetical protein